MSARRSARADTGTGYLVALGLGLGFLTGAIVLFILGAGEHGDPWLLAGAGGCVLLAIVVPIALAVRLGNAEERARVEVLASGPRVEATIVEVRHGTLNRSSAYRVIAQGANPITGEPQHFIGPSLRRDPGRHLRDRTTIAIAIDPVDPTRGVMDFSFLPGDRPVGWTACTTTLPSSY